MTEEQKGKNRVIVKEWRLQDFMGHVHQEVGKGYVKDSTQTEL